jgi:hypothetical protein
MTTAFQNNILNIKRRVRRKKINGKKRKSKEARPEI